MNIINHSGGSSKPPEAPAPQQQTGTISFQEACALHANVANAQADLEHAARLAARAAVSLRQAALVHSDSEAFADMLNEVTHASGTMLTLSAVCQVSNMPLGAMIQPGLQKAHGGDHVPDNVQPFPAVVSQPPAGPASN